MGINWHSIRSLGGSQPDGFEELCTQLASAASPKDAEFVRKGTPDAGVECYAILDDDSEWGWQAKYFTSSLEASQWAQLDKSVKTALERHPRLCRYYMCIPIDLPDARTDGQQSAWDKWNDHVVKWTTWASKRGMKIEFIYWGSHELLNILTAPEHVGRVRFWFNTPAFDDSWFKARLGEATAQAGPRYTPKLHVNLPIADKFEAFGRTSVFLDIIKSQSHPVRENLRSFKHISTEDIDNVPEIASAKSEIIENTQQILVELCNFDMQPVGMLPFEAISMKIDVVVSKAEELTDKLFEFESKYDTKVKSDGDKNHSMYHSNPFQNTRYSLLSLKYKLNELGENLEDANHLTNSDLLILSGDAGTGKTHLLCDVTHNRVNEGCPTILLMGQRFLSPDEPWTQVLKQLDLRGVSAEEFVGALEASAQVAGCRALIIIDALNEGKGQDIWLNHLAAFLAQIKRSPWIGVILSIRSSYEQLIIPDDIQKYAVSLKHHGFVEHEYDATRTFFLHYGLETPSSPLLAPEFSNPLFLKTICIGLKDRGDHRLPRGFHGITAIFKLFLDAINKKLASELGFNVKKRLVHKALTSFIEALLKVHERWLLLEDAENIVNKLLPDRDFERSLYRGLVSEGILIEDIATHQNGEYMNVVLVAYERFADYLIANSLLDTYLDVTSPEKTFEPDAPLGFVSDKTQFISLGLFEALCLQIPERTGKELIELVPAIKDRFDVNVAFRQSVIWRDSDAFSDATFDILNELTCKKYDQNETFDVLLTLSTLPAHPLNADYLDGNLRKHSMPLRDAWWSVYLHESWGSRSAVDRLVDWASTVQSDSVIEDEVIDLCSTALAWMLTTSNRSLRDNATKALVNLLTGQLEAVSRLVERFADVDDPYVTERVYAVAYGTAMRSNDSAEVGILATCVYNQVFAKGIPPTHILLRDYARGVIERALNLEAKIDVITDLIRPPYNSVWPNIPTEDEIKSLLQSCSSGSYDSGDLEWSRNRIRSSVMADDFARYVIGTNFRSTDFSSLGLDEPMWQSPDELLATLILEFSEKAKKEWNTFDDINNKIKKRRVEISTFWLREFTKDVENEANGLNDSDSTMHNLQQDQQLDIDILKKELNVSLENLKILLTKDQSQQLDKILIDMKNRLIAPPCFDLSIIQRYVLWRVFNLGWTTELFGEFDRFWVGRDNRGPSKVERIGKKYQWIAYHEIMALVADNFQYFGRYYANTSEYVYKGPWQIHLRDIDPSFTLKMDQKETLLDKDSHAWWNPNAYDNWNFPAKKLDWLNYTDDLPQIEDFLIKVCPEDGSRWLNLQGRFDWKQSSTECDVSGEKRNLFYLMIGYLIHEEDVESFNAWAKNVELCGRWAPEPPSISHMFFGEYSWSPASQYFQQEYLGNEEWTQLDRDCPVKIQTTALEYNYEMNGFDFSVDKNYSLKLLSPYLINGLGLQWDVCNSYFVDKTNQIVAFNPSVNMEYTKTLLVRQDKLEDFLAQKKLALCWIVIGEKLTSEQGPITAALNISGAYVLTQNGPEGFTKYVLENNLE